MFGAGNEPSTLAQFEAMFPADYYEYNAGTLMSAQVNEVVEQGKNLTLITNNKETSRGLTFNKKSESEFVVTGTNDGTGTSTYFVFGKTVPQWLADLSGETITVTGYASGMSLAMYDKNWNGVTFTAEKPTGVVPDLSYGDELNCYIQTSYSYQDETLVKLQIEKSSSATEYSAPFKNIYPIPQSILDLDGYGWGITDEVCNYVDWENKTYHQRIGSVDLGTLDWKSQGTGTSDKYCYYANLPKTANGSGGTYMPNCICVKYVRGTNNQTYSNIECISPVSDIVKVYDDKYSDSNDASAFKTAMSGVMLYYELAEEVVTDISDLIGDTFQNPFTVEAGGTLTFKNQNGDDYRIPVPNEEEYLIALAEVTA